MADPTTSAGPDVSDRSCPECGRYAMFGFGPPNSSVGVRWYCGAHRSVGKAWWDGMTGANGVERSGPRAPGLF
jgi:hypothetical protein